MKKLIPSKVPPFLMAAMIIVPKTVPAMLPTAPVNEAPPTTTAAIASSSYPCPAVGTPLPNRAVIRIPAADDIKALNA